MKRLSSKLTYSNVVATLAVFLVLAGGTAIAATRILPKNSVGPSQIRKRAVTPAKLSTAAEAVLTGTRGPKGDPGPTGAAGPKGDPGNPGERGETGERGAPATALWAEVSGAAALRKGSGALSAAHVGGVGGYQVVFDQDVSGCSYQATLSEEGEFGFLVVQPRTANPDALYIEAANPSGVLANRGFYLAVFC